MPTLDRAVLERQPAIPLEAKAGEHLAFPLGAESHNPLDAFKRTKADVRFWHLADIHMSNKARVCNEKGGPQRAALEPALVS